MFSAADLIVVNKTDLLPYVDFDVDRLTTDARALRPGVEVLTLSARAGENVDAWYAWLANLQPVNGLALLSLCKAAALDFRQRLMRR
jgi:hydrogenase nickel incorporation protein HypB